MANVKRLFASVYTEFQEVLTFRLCTENPKRNPKNPESLWKKILEKILKRITEKLL